MPEFFYGLAYIRSNIEYRWPFGIGQEKCHVFKWIPALGWIPNNIEARFSNQSSGGLPQVCHLEFGLSPIGKLDRARDGKQCKLWAFVRMAQSMIKVCRGPRRLSFGGSRIAGNVRQQKHCVNSPSAANPQKKPTNPSVYDPVPNL